MEDSVRDAEKLYTELKQRRERLIDANNISSTKKMGLRTHIDTFTNSLGKLQEQLKVLLGVQGDLNHSYLVLSRSRVQPGQSSKENARIKRRKKENK